MTIPYIGFGNDTLNRQPKLKHGDVIQCPQCKGEHTVEDSKPPMVLTYQCGSATYVAGINGHSIMNVSPDTKGEI